MRKLINLIDFITQKTGMFILGILLLLIATVFYDVVQRYFFNSTSAFFFELEWHLFGTIILLGMSYTLLHDRHVRIDVFYERMTYKKRAFVDFIGDLMLLFPFASITFYFSCVYAYRSFLSGETSATPNAYSIFLL